MKRYLLLFLLLAAPAFAQHLPAHQALHEQFYKDWMMPDKPWVGCCSNQDCQPAASKFESGQWWARWEGWQEWVPIPTAKVEEKRDSPDGRSHMCGRVLEGNFFVYCFVRGGGV